MQSRTTIRLRRDLMVRAKQRAAERKTTFTRLIEEALVAYLAKPAPKPPPRAVRLPSFGDPSRRLRWEDLRREIEAQELADDARGRRAGKKRDAAA